MLIFSEVSLHINTRERERERIRRTNDKIRSLFKRRGKRGGEREKEEKRKRERGKGLTCHHQFQPNVPKQHQFYLGNQGLLLINKAVVVILLLLLCGFCCLFRKKNKSSFIMRVYYLFISLIKRTKMIISKKYTKTLILDVRIHL